MVVAQLRATLYVIKSKTIFQIWKNIYISDQNQIFRVAWGGPPWEKLNYQNGGQYTKKSISLNCILITLNKIKFTFLIIRANIEQAQFITMENKLDVGVMFRYVVKFADNQNHVVYIFTILVMALVG